MFPITSGISSTLAMDFITGLYKLCIKAIGANACINRTLLLYSGRSDAITKKEVVPCECPM